MFTLAGSIGKCPVLSAQQSKHPPTAPLHQLIQSKRIKVPQMSSAAGGTQLLHHDLTLLSHSSGALA